MSSNDDLIAEIAAQLPPKRGRGRPRKEKRRKSSMRTKKVRRATTTDFDVIAAAHALHGAAGYLQEKLLQADLQLHYDFMVTLTLLIQRIQKTATGLSLHLNVPSNDAFKTEALTAIEHEKASSWHKQNLTKKLTQNMSEVNKKKIWFK